MTTTVRLGIDTDLVSAADAREVAKLYLPDSVPSNRWDLETFTWRPSDATLAALEWPLVPDSDTLVSSGLSVLVGGPTAYFAQVVLADIPDELNPGSGLGYLAGTLTGARVRIRKGTLTIAVSLDRHLGAPIDVTGMGVSYADVAPLVTYYDTRIAHP